MLDTRYIHEITAIGAVMSKLLCAIAGGAILAIGCGTPAADSELAADATTTGATPKAASSRPAPVNEVATKASLPSYREVTIPSGTTLSLSLTSGVASDTSKVEDAVSAELMQAVTVDGRNVLPAGSTVAGQVTSGIGAGVGAAVGGLLGGKSGAAKGAAVGGGAGTGVVLATKGQEMRLAPGADVTTTLTAPLTVRVRI
jgi:hypothetical protein